ncbi:family 43 glycosylhydrolase [Flavicella sediminum]|uniref:family 43 glycosylhydrolase n=1 Tax=Flavicella sediminum TaxID=2585141 RepID=UPI00111E0D7A|nr:family 43 glycosylhydrolase [Flavicella sediminum]
MKKTPKKIVTFLLVHVFVFCAIGQNPIIDNSGISDPHIRVFKDTIYLYSGHDASPNDKLWIMKDWRVFSTTDLIDWKHRTTIRPKDNYMDASSSDCWASDAASKNGKYYFYFSDKKRGVGVMSATSPVGPFVDKLGKALVSPMHDPTVFIDSDKNKTAYILYGDKEGGGFRLAKLQDDMMSLSEQAKTISIVGEEWNSAPEWMDKSYLFKNKDTYYLSWGRDYATSKNIYGPYKCVGALGNGHHLNEFAHGSFFNWKGQFYHIWCYYIRPGYKYRESIISYCHIDTNGKIHTDTAFLDQHFKNGVGQYNASWDKIEAEWYYEVFGDLKKELIQEKEFALSNFKNENGIRFANMTFDKAYSKFVSNISFKGEKGVLEIRRDSVKGELLGAIDLSKANSSGHFQKMESKIVVSKGVKDIFLVYKGSNKAMLALDWFKFES